MIPSFVIRAGLIAVALIAATANVTAGMTSYTDRGKTDFDTALQVLNPYGTWSKIDGLWAYTPSDHHHPYTNGRWIYTEYGWYWKGNTADSWATEHYGYWKCGENKVWSWYPGAYWLPQTVEIRATTTHIGWRSAAVDEDGSFVEQPVDRYSKPEEWAFVTLSQFTQPITPAVLASEKDTETQLEDSTDSMHSYLTYRQIDRPGPHPADFASYPNVYGGMFPARTIQDQIAAQPQTPTKVVVPGYTPSTNNPAAKMTGTNAPALLGADDATDPNADRRQVKYWITMSLPSYWTPVPATAKSNEIYLYHPDFYQDNDGIERRVTLWFNPYTRTTLQDVIAENTPLKKSDGGKKTNDGPALPAIPASSDSEAASAFRSPLDESYHAEPAPETPSGKAASSKAPAPAGMKNEPAVPTGATNAP